MDKYIKTTSIAGLLILEWPTFEDERGFFKEVFHLDELQQALGYEFKPVQWNHSKSKPGVLRGQHAENWNKLIYPVTGELFASVVDIRVDSVTFGKYETFTFNNENRCALFIPKGMANSFCVTGKEDVNYLYLVDAYWDGSDTKAIAWDDPDINIKWPIENPIISERDKNNPKLRELLPEKFK
ncbi:MAG: dTDP-4-dehydrorhamnose 3,5-epimerase family protein [Candidatus Daviesbacteria bacterium]|nr:dTDP-4-dehydrorhamnose 3,5-epimerase family protein [Candidatus Daviesbacteria bacterium]